MQGTVSVLNSLHYWPVPVISGVDGLQPTPVEIRSKEEFILFLGQHQARQTELFQSLSNSSNSEELGFSNVLFYINVIENLASSVTSAVQSRAYPGFLPKAYAVDCLLSSVVSLTPVRALGAVYYFRGSSLTGQEFATYVAYSRLVQETLIESSEVDSEVSQTIKSSIYSIDHFIMSLDAITDEIGAKMKYVPNRSVTVILFYFIVVPFTGSPAHSNSII